MFYVLVYICAITLSGSDCIPVREPLVPGYIVKEDCEKATRAIIEMMKATPGTDPRLQYWPRRPWSIKGFCITPVIDETYVGGMLPAHPKRRG